MPSCQSVTIRPTQAQQVLGATTLWEAVGSKEHGVQDVDNLLIDLLAYKRAELVQEALALLISRHCQRQRMLTNLIRTQLVVTASTCKRFNKSMDLLVRVFLRVFV